MKPRRWRVPAPSAFSTDRTIFAVRRRAWCGVMVAVAAGAAWVYFVSSSPLVQAEFAFRRGDHREARELATRILRADATSDRALVIVGSASLAIRDAVAAKSYFERVSAGNGPDFGQAQRELGQIAIGSGHAVRAEEHLRKSLEVDPYDSAALDQLIYLLSLEGRNWEAFTLAVDRLRAGMITANYLMIVGQPELGLEQTKIFAERCLAVVPDEPLPRLALARQAWRDNRAELAKDQLDPVLKKHPDLLEAHALLCLITAETGTTDEFNQVSARIPSSAMSHPDVWLGRGMACDNRGLTDQAARCYWEALRCHPNSVSANHRLSQALVKLKKPAEARPFAERAQQLGKLALDMASLRSKLDPGRLPVIIGQLEDLGRLWEAAGWCHAALQQSPRQSDWARGTLARLTSHLDARQPLTVPEFDPTTKIDLSHVPLPVFRNAVPSAIPSAVPTTIARIAFQDDADASGLHFTYQNGAPPGDLESMIEMNGGGVAVLDYDGDHWPDIFFTQGGNFPPAAFDGRLTDLLFRNAGDRVTPGFDNVTEAAGLSDVGYGQGVTVGDFDNDGFPDLYVGNVGQNQLLHNNGDGTFSDITVTSGTLAGGWTSSSVFADFNQDGLPDLYVVTYLGGEEIYQLCNKRVRPRCSPLLYPAEPDRFYLNLGDGRFRELSGSHGLAAAEGRGLGVVAADFDGSRRLSLFVGNDMTANFFFQNQTTVPDALLFEERAIPSGLAFDHAGQAKACMGIAAGDYDKNGRLDLFVTNFYRQTNDLYAQEEGGTFQDVSVRTGLAEPGFLMLGWGTQFLDADLDGFSDLVVTNGHVHDPVDAKIPYAMPAQCFRNRGNGQFVEVSRPQLGPFFDRPRMGRALARLDWNRDGLDDVCISHLNERAALLTNRTEMAGNSLSLRLIAVNSARDAIGARVRITAGNQVTVRQLTAGDGFHASNERRLNEGLGANRVADLVDVEWPSGVRQQFERLDVDREWILVEQRPAIPVSIAADGDLASSSCR